MDSAEIGSSAESTSHHHSWMISPTRATISSPTQANEDADAKPTPHSSVQETSSSSTPTSTPTPPSPATSGGHDQQSTNGDQHKTVERQWRRSRTRYHTKDQNVAPTSHANPAAASASSVTVQPTQPPRAPHPSSALLPLTSLHTHPHPLSSLKRALVTALHVRLSSPIFWFVMCQLIWLLLLCGVLFLAVHPLQRRMSDTLSQLDASLARASTTTTSVQTALQAMMLMPEPEQGQQAGSGPGAGQLHVQQPRAMNVDQIRLWKQQMEWQRQQQHLQQLKQQQDERMRQLEAQAQQRAQQNRQGVPADTTMQRDANDKHLRTISPSIMAHSSLSSPGYWPSLFTFAAAAAAPSEHRPHAHAQPALHGIDEEEEEGFDVFSERHFSAQYIILYRRDERQHSLLHQGFTSDADFDVAAFHHRRRSAVHNVTRSLLRQHAPFLRLLMPLDSLPGCVANIDLDLLSETAADAEQPGSATQRLLESIRSHPEVLMVTRDQRVGLELTTIVGPEMTMLPSISVQNLESGSKLPPNIRRIHAGSRSSVAQAARVGVAVMDTGIDLDHPGLNAKNGINCVAKIEEMRQRQRRRRNRRLEDEQTLIAISGNVQADATDDIRHAVDEDEEESFLDGWDFELDHALAMDDNNHGTHVSGIIGGRNIAGSMVGVAPDTAVWAVKILDRRGQGSWAHMLCGINWILDHAPRHNIKVVSMSLAGTGRNDNACGERINDALHKAICIATQTGLLFVAAAGNSAADLSRVVPATYPEVLTVTAMADSDGEPGAFGPPLTCRGYESDDHVAGFSNYALVPLDRERKEYEKDNRPTPAGEVNKLQPDEEENQRHHEPQQHPSFSTSASPHDSPSTPSSSLSSSSSSSDWMLSPLLVDGANHTLSIRDHIVSAPGVCIISSIPKGRYGTYSGTSQACPHVSALVALAHGSGDYAGVCWNRPPLDCMHLIVQRAKELERRAGMAYGFLPWTIGPDGRIDAERATDIVLVRPHEQDENDNGGWKGEEESAMLPTYYSFMQSSPYYDSPMSDAIMLGAHDHPASFPPLADTHLPGLRQMRKYYGPLIVGGVR